MMLAAVVDEVVDQLRIGEQCQTAGHSAVKVAGGGPRGKTDTGAGRTCKAELAAVAARLR